MAVSHVRGARRGTSRRVVGADRRAGVMMIACLTALEGLGHSRALREAQLGGAGPESGGAMSSRLRAEAAISRPSHKETSTAAGVLGVLGLVQMGLSLSLMRT